MGFNNPALELENDEEIETVENKADVITENHIMDLILQTLASLCDGQNQTMQV